MRKVMLFSVTFLFIGGATLLAQAKIGVVNSPALLEKSVEGKRVIAQIQDRDKQYQASIAKLDEDIRQIQTKLNLQRLTLTEETIAQMTTDSDKKQTDRKRLAEDAYSYMDELQKRLFKKVTDELAPLIEQIGKEKGLDIILELPRAGVAWFSPTIDLTADVIKRYDAVKSGQIK
jgi:Skp family chaperone for outer membrane proteins